MQLLRAVIKTNHANMHGCTGKNPLAVTLCKENVPRLLYAFQHFAICAAAYSLCGKQPRTFAFFIFDLLPCFFKPVAAKIGLAGDAVAENFAEFLDVSIAKFPPHKLVTQKWRISNNHVAFRPCPFRINFEKVILSAVFLRLRGL